MAVGGIDTHLKYLSPDLKREINSNNLAIFVNNHFYEGTHFIHDGWNGYNLLNYNINYTHEIHNHGEGDFEFYFHSTSHIEPLWF